MKYHGLKAEELKLAYGDKTVVHGVDFEVQPGKVTVLVGPNGCGKSTLLRGIAAVLDRQAGRIVLDGREISEYRTRDIARRLGLLPQAPATPEAITVRDICALGRYPHQNWLKIRSAADDAAMEEAMNATGVLELADRPLDTLSGGQRQRAWIAMVIAQETEYLLLDEPTTYLDMGHQLEVLDLIRDINAAGRSVVMVLHDLNQAARYADEIVIMQEGRIYGRGNPHEMMTTRMINEVFGVHCHILQSGNRPHCVRLGRVCDRGCMETGTASEPSQPRT